MIDSYDKIFRNKDRIMFVFSHPDDAEVTSGGTIARLIKDGKLVRVVKVTSGNRGSKQNNVSQDELSSIREEEDRSAMKILGVIEENNIHLKFRDGEVENSHEVIGAIARQIRIFKPDIIITHNPENVLVRFNEDESWVNHRDHRNTAKSTIDAAYPYSRDLLYFPEHFDEPEAASHTVTEFLLTDYFNHPDEIKIDITKYKQTRINALKAHVSQIPEGIAEDLTERLNASGDGKYYERFRYVNAR